MYKYKLIVLIFSVILFFNEISINYSYASDQASLISSGKGVLYAWEKMLSKGYLDVSQDKGGGWKVTKHLWPPGSGSYDIKKSDSIVSPYILIIKFKTRHCGSNFFSLNANGPYYAYFKRKCGFNSAQEALANCNNTDFVNRDVMSGQISPAKEDLYDILISYLYQDGSWVISKGNENFMIFFGQDLKSDLNGEYFKDLLTVPAK
jgi:hypothetical protein